MTSTQTKNQAVVISDIKGKDLEGLREIKKPRFTKLTLSFFICVVLPLLTSSVYYVSLASDRYASRVGFSVRGIEGGAAGFDGIASLTGLVSTGTTTSDSYIILSYLRSRELVEILDQRLGLRAAYSSPKVDWFSRLKPDASVETFLKYWSRRIDTQFDPTSGIVEFEVQSFSPKHAQQIASLILDLTKNLINQLSINARNDVLRSARGEVEREEKRLRQALASIRDFRVSEQTFDPNASASLETQLIANLEAQLIDTNARIEALSRTLNSDAPSLKALRRFAGALNAQIIKRRTAIGTTISAEVGRKDVTGQLAIFEELDVERNVAQQAYSSALVSLEQARRDADRQHRYLAVHVHPSIPETAEYPHRVTNILVISFVLVMGWGVMALLVYSVRDHLT